MDALIYVNWKSSTEDVNSKFEFWICLRAPHVTGTCDFKSNTRQFTMTSLHEVASFVLVGALWGCTNPLLKAGSEATTPASASGAAKGRGPLASFFAEIGALLANWKFVLPFLLNQCGSVAYTAALGSSAISLAMPICNSLALLFNCITSRLLGERALDSSTCRATLLLYFQSLSCSPALSICTYVFIPESIVGMMIILLGVAICVDSQQRTSIFAWPARTDSM